MTDGDPPPAALVGSLVRRIRRNADCSQRELANRLEISATAVAQAETGARDLPATVLARAAGLAGLRLGLLDADGREVVGMTPDGVRDRADRRYPAHLDVRRGEQDWWHGVERYSRARPTYTFDRNRHYRDWAWRSTGAPSDHPRPRPGDDPAVRASVRKAAALIEAEDRRAAAVAERRRLGIVFDGADDPVCTCPAACEELLFAEEPLPARLQAVPHREDCTCRCDIA